MGMRARPRDSGAGASLRARHGRSSEDRGCDGQGIQGAGQRKRARLEQSWESRRAGHRQGKAAARRLGERRGAASRKRTEGGALGRAADTAGRGEIQARREDSTGGDAGTSAQRRAEAERAPGLASTQRRWAPWGGATRQSAMEAERMGRERSWGKGARAGAGREMRPREKISARQRRRARQPALEITTATRLDFSTRAVAGKIKGKKDSDG